MQLDDIKNIEQYIAALPKFQTSGKKAVNFDLNHFEQFCEQTGNPQKEFASIHVAGTNGKGSTCRLLASIYTAAGYKTALYTSPHIHHFTERFRIDGHEIPEEDLVVFFSEHLQDIERHKLSYFELSTAIAFWWFAREEVDIAVIEVGLGGRLDATNIIRSEVSVITSVGLDHTDILGDTIEAIAREKAGIIKESVPVVMGNLMPEAQKVVRAKAAGCNCTVYAAADLQPAWQQGACILTSGTDMHRFECKLKAPVQAWNVAIAWQVKEVLNARFGISLKEFEEGVQGVQKLYPHAGCFEQLVPGKDWYFDGAHNVEAVQAMKTAVRTIKPVSDTILILSLMRDKISKEMMYEFLEFKKILYYSLKTERSARFDEVQQWLPDLQRFPAPKELQTPFFKEIESELVIFTGSFYFYTTVRDWLLTSATSR